MRRRIEKVAREELDPRERLFCLSRGRRVEPLRESLRRAGQINPVVVRRGVGERYQLIHGFRRVQALEELGELAVLVMVLEGEEASDRRAFDLMFFDNLTTRGFNLAEAARAVHFLSRHLRLSSEEIMEGYLPALGFEPAAKILVDLLAAAELEEEWLDWLAAGRLPLPIARLLSALPGSERRELSLLLLSLQPGRNFLRELVLLLLETTARENTTISALLADSGLRRRLAARNDRRARLESVISYLRERRQPSLSRFLSRLEELKRRVSLPPNVIWKTPSNFDPLTLVLEVQADSAQSLSQAGEALAAAAARAETAAIFEEWNGPSDESS